MIIARTGNMTKPIKKHALTMNRGLTKRGWIVWTWGKMGSLLVFMGMMLMMFTAYGFAGGSAQADSANQLSQSLKNLILDTYDSASGMSFEYALPKNLDGENYSIEILNKSGDTVGITTKTRRGSSDVFGATSLSVPLSKRSFGVIKGFGQELPYACIVKYKGVVYVERSKCE